MSQYTDIITAFVLTHAATILAYTALLLVIAYKERYIKLLRRDMKLYTTVMKEYKTNLMDAEAREKELIASRRLMMRDLKKEREENGRYREILRKLEKQHA